MSGAFQGKNLLALAVLAGAVNTAPLLVFDNGSDVLFRYEIIRCFAEQFWQGDVYPRWCMDSNAGLGAPLLLIYFPLAHLQTALLYPLHRLGMSIENIYLLSVWLCNVVTFMAVRCWLRDMAGEGVALLCAFIYLWLPYRMELLMYRAAFSELWLMALLPLLLLYTRRLAMGKEGAGIRLAVTVALMFLMHLTSTLNALFACGLYMLGMAGRDWKKLAYFTLAVAWAALATAFYVAPAAFYQRFLSPEGLSLVPNVWVSTFIDADMQHIKLLLVLNLAVTALAVAVLALRAYRKRGLIGDRWVRREYAVVVGSAAVSLCLMFSITAPLWHMVDVLGNGLSPWRMHLVIAVAAVYCLAVNMQWLASAKQLKTWKFDYALLVGLLLMIALPMGQFWTPEQRAVFDRMMRADYVIFRELSSRWVDADHIKAETIVDYSEQPPKARAEVIKGSGAVTVKNWDIHGITLQAKLTQSSTIRLEHFYFPVWQARMDGMAQSLSPQEGTGRILLDVPAGEHSITLYRDTYQALPPLLRWTRWSPFLAGGLLLAMGVMQRRRPHG